MKDQLLEKLHQINYLTAELDALYHQAALKLGMADSIMYVLYILRDHGGACPLSLLYKRSGISKQTIHSAIRKLEKDRLLDLIPCDGRSKQVVLTEQGTQYAAQTVDRLFEAELTVFDGWSDEEIETHIRLTKQYTADFRRSLNNLNQ